MHFKVTHWCEYNNLGKNESSVDNGHNKLGRTYAHIIRECRTSYKSAWAYIASYYIAFEFIQHFTAQRTATNKN